MRCAAISFLALKIWYFVKFHNLFRKSSFRTRIQETNYCLKYITEHALYPLTIFAVQCHINLCHQHWEYPLYRRTLQSHQQLLKINDIKWPIHLLHLTNCLVFSGQIFASSTEPPITSQTLTVKVLLELGLCSELSKTPVSIKHFISLQKGSVDLSQQEMRHK